MRTRSKYNVVTPVAQTPNGAFEADPINLGKTFSDLLTPGYFRLIKEGKHLPVNPASSSEQYFVPSGGTCKHEVWSAGNYNGWKWQKTREINLSGCIYLSCTANTNLPSIGIGALPTFTESERNALMTTALAGALTQKMDILTFAVEARKTAELVTGVAGRMLERAHKVKELLTRRGLKSAPDDFARAWLEQRYGWRTLAYDVEDAAQMVSDLMNGVSELRRSSTSRSKDGVSSSSIVKTEGFSWRQPASSISGREINQGIAYEHVIRKTGRMECRAGVMIRDSIRSYATVDPLVTGMEILPFSFLLDWVINISDFLTVISPFASADIQHMYNTFTSVEEVTIQSTPVPKTFAFNTIVTEYRASGSSAPLVWGRTGWNREPVSGFQPTLGRGSGLNAMKAIDVLALLKGRIRSLRRFTII